MKSTALSWLDKIGVDRLVADLKAHRVAVTSTDTVFGLLAQADEQGFEHLNRIKKRGDKPYLILISGADRLADFVELPLAPAVDKLVRHCWPGPLTLIFKARPGVPEYMLGAGGTIAIRVPAHPGLLSILPHFRALFSTSANLSGERPPESVDALSGEILGQIACLVADEHPLKSLPSTIIDCSGEKLKVVREGAYAVAELEGICGEMIEK